MGKRKKNDAGLARAYRLFDGENKKANNVSNAKTVVFFTLQLIMECHPQIDLFGLDYG